MTIAERIAVIREHLEAIEAEQGVSPMAAPPSGGSGQTEPPKPPKP